MTRDELAQKLHGLSVEEFANHKYDLSGFVVVSCIRAGRTDKIQFSGDINATFTYDMGLADKLFIDTDLTPMHRLEDEFWCNENDRPFNPQPINPQGNFVAANFCYLWMIKTVIPHSDFRIGNVDDYFAIDAGIVINTADLRKVWPSKGEE